MMAALEAALKRDNMVCVITGATSGIGLGVAELLTEQNARIIGVGRSAGHCAAALERLLGRGTSPQSIAFVTADLSLQSEVRRLGTEISAVLDSWGHPHLDALINNAATVPFWQTLTPEGFDMQWAVNHLAPFLLTAELLPRLRLAPTSRVITVSSGSHRGGRLDWNDIQLLRHYSPLRAYSMTKLANVLFTLELNRRLGAGTTVRAFAADPGLVNTEIGMKSNSVIARIAWDIRRRGGVPARQSAAGIVFLATEPAIQDSIHLYWKDMKPVRPGARASNPQSARQLWELSAQMCGIQA
jgi:NAD(P)-dependent dehydrogenase (short-subunit alcohol dehydrogenase family)